MIVSELGSTATATARFPRHHALKYINSLVTPLATAVAAVVAAKTDTSQDFVNDKYYVIVMYM